MSDDTHLQHSVSRWRDRLFGWRAVAATTLASVILGSAGGAALAAAADGSGAERGGFPGRGPFPGGGQFPGQPGMTGPTGSIGTQNGRSPLGLPAQPQGQQLPGAWPTSQPATLPRNDGEEA